LRSPSEAVRRGLALLPEDRKSDGLLLPFSVCANTTLAHLDLASDRLGRLHPHRESQIARDAVETLELRARSLDQPVAQLSGGNQQKVLLARWLLRDSDILLVDEPTRGIDIGTRAEVHRLLVELAASGKALVVASSEHEELLALCDRILVLCAGQVSAELRRGTEDEWTSEAVLRAAIGGADQETAA
jgi:ribose transport system ATP-binding protein